MTDTTPTITLEAHGANRVTANWTDEGGARHHVWIVETFAGWEIQPTIYKNPPLQADGGFLPSSAPGHFPTRQLDLHAKAHKAVAARIDALATPEALQAVCDAYMAKYKRERDERLKWGRIAYLACALAAIETADPEELEAAKAANEAAKESTR